MSTEIDLGANKRFQNGVTPLDERNLNHLFDGIRKALKQTTIALALDSPNHSFGSINKGAAVPNAFSTTLRNTGLSNSGDLNLTNSNPAAFNASLSSTEGIASGETRILTVRPNINLSAGTYNTTITVTGTNGGSATFTASFEVHTPQFSTLIHAENIEPHGNFNVYLPSNNSQDVIYVVLEDTLYSLESINMMLQTTDYYSFDLGSISGAVWRMGDTLYFEIRNFGPHVDYITIRVYA